MMVREMKNVHYVPIVPCVSNDENGFSYPPLPPIQQSVVALVAPEGTLYDRSGRWTGVTSTNQMAL